MSRRTERLGSMIQQELAEVIMRELHDPRLQGFPSITRVKVSADLSIADVFMTVMGTAGQQTAALNALRHAAGLMRTRLTKSLSIRQAPFLKFHLDESAKKEIELLDLIRKAADDTAQRERERGAAIDEQLEAQSASDAPPADAHNQSLNAPDPAPYPEPPQD